MRALSMLMLGAILIAAYIATSEAGKTVISGNTVGIKYPAKGGHWLGCWPQFKCVPASCPGEHFPPEKQTCAGEIFQIYKRKGSGKIKVGDDVGLYYIHAKKWVSAWGIDGGVASCPGAPSSKFGMNIEADQCGGEVFRVYAKDKSIGENVRDDDYIMLNYKYGGHAWFTLWMGYSHTASCPGGAYPPPDFKYQECKGEVFQIKKLYFSE